MYCSICSRMHVGLGLPVAPLQIGDDAFEADRALPQPAELVLVREGDPLSGVRTGAFCCVSSGNSSNGRVPIDAVMIADRLQQLRVIAAGRPAQAFDGALPEGHLPCREPPDPGSTSIRLPKPSQAGQAP